MKTRTVHTKSELKQAVKDNVDRIIISKELEKDLKPLITVMSKSPKQIAMIAGAFGVGGAAAVAAVAAAPATMGISAIAAIPGVALFAAPLALKTGTDIIVIILLLLLCVIVGVDCIVKLMNSYRIQKTDVGLEFRNIKFKTTTQYYES